MEERGSRSELCGPMGFPGSTHVDQSIIRGPSRESPRTPRAHDFFGQHISLHRVRRALLGHGTVELSLHKVRRAPLGHGIVELPDRLRVKLLRASLVLPLLFRVPQAILLVKALPPVALLAFQDQSADRPSTCTSVAVAQPAEARP